MTVLLALAPMIILFSPRSLLAQIALTPYGTNNAFTLVPYVTGLPQSNTIGPVGIVAVPPPPMSGGNTALWIGDYGNNTLYQFNDVLTTSTTGLTFNDQLGSVPYPGTGIAGFATVLLSDGVHYYMAEQSSGQVIEFSPLNGAPIRTVSGPISCADVPCALSAGRPTRLHAGPQQPL